MGRVRREAKENQHQPAFVSFTRSPTCVCCFTSMHLPCDVWLNTRKVSPLDGSRCVSGVQVEHSRSGESASVKELASGMTIGSRCSAAGSRMATEPRCREKRKKKRRGTADNGFYFLKSMINTSKILLYTYTGAGH